MACFQPRGWIWYDLIPYGAFWGETTKELHKTCFNSA